MTGLPEQPQPRRFSRMMTVLNRVSSSRITYHRCLPLVNVACSLICIALMTCSADAALQESSALSSAEPRVTRLTMGFTGVGRVGNWLPIRLEAAGVAPQAEVTLIVTASDPRGDLCESKVAAARSDDNGNLTLEGVFITGRTEGVIRLRLEDSQGNVQWRHSVACSPADLARVNATATAMNEDGTVSTEEAPGKESVASRMLLHRHSSLTLLSIGQPAGLNELAVRLAEANKSRDVLTLLSVENIGDVPSVRRGLDAADTMLLVTEYGLNADQTRAVREWVLNGGQLIVSCGTNLSALLSSPVGEWLKPEFGIQNELLQSQDLTALQNFVSGASQLQTNRQNVPIVRLASEQPRVVVDSINGPMISRLSFGAGIVTMVTVDLNQRPLNRWLSLSQFYEILLFDRILDSAGEQSNRGGRISSSGVTDLATQLAAVSDAIPPDERWSSWHVMLLMVIFLAVIGPLDYVIAVRVLKRPRLTWVTFPALVAASCGLTVWWSTSQRGNATVREVSLVDVSQYGSQQSIRARTWSSLSTSDSRFAAVAAQPKLKVANAVPQISEQNLIWHGRAEDVYGGLYREGGAGLGQQTSRRTDVGKAMFTSIPLLVDGSQAFLAETLHTSEQTPIFESRLMMPASGLLEGSFTHHLPVSIRDWVIVFGNRVYLPSPKAEERYREIPPDEPWTRTTGSIRVSEVRDFLRGVRLVSRERKKGDTLSSPNVQIQSSYNIAGRNPLDILLMISMYNTAGGETYVRLQDNYLRRDEVSDAVQLNTALLIGVADLPVSELLLDDVAVAPSASQTIVRFFLPVRRTSSTDLPQEADPKADTP